MPERLLMSNSNKIQLQDAIQDQTLDEVASALLTASSNEELHQAVLNGAASLPKLTDHFDDERASRVLKAIRAKILSPQLRLDTHQSPLVTEAGLACIHLLSSRRCQMDETTLLELAAYTDESDPWTTCLSAETAGKILNLQLSEDKRLAFISNTILQGYLKPLFTRSSTRVTESGRPLHYDVPPDRHRPVSQAAAWKQENRKAIAILRWAVTESNTPFIKNHWPLFTPVMLALVEDDEPKIKSRGLEVLAAFVKKCPESVLHGTGIGSVFEEATFPVLLHLPSITPEEESIQLLVPAYQVLINLAEAYAEPGNTDRRRILDKTLRHGVFTSYHHGSQYVHVVQTLMRYTTVIINCLGIYSIKHLQNLLSILSTVMTDLFATAYPPALLSAAEALNAVIVNCWPRILDSDHAEQIIRTISLCWLNLRDDNIGPELSSKDRDEISAKLLKSARILQAVWKQQKAQPPGKLAEVLNQEPRLKSLFAMSRTEDGKEESSWPQ